ncbi:hypothetical protein, partial [Falsiroseomonas oryzae]|uniref:hypothetical protein n=1 Tax=Falsiroseomonas oryzae TaxID=2766473 RepID=UPI0038CBFA1A
MTRRRLLGAAGLALAVPPAALAEADPQARGMARLALLLAEAVEAELRRAEASLSTVAAMLEAGRPNGPGAALPLPVLDQAVRGAAGALGLPVAGLDALLAPLVDSEAPPGTPLPASPAGDLAADALTDLRPVAGLFGGVDLRLGLAVPVLRYGAGRAIGVLVATLPGEHLAARLAMALAAEGPMDEIVSARLVGAAAEGEPVETLAWIRAGEIPGRLVLPDAPAAVFEMPPPGSDQAGRLPSLLLATQRLRRAPRCAVVLAARPVPAAAPSRPTAPLDDAAGTTGSRGMALATAGLGGAGIGAL